MCIRPNRSIIASFIIFLCALAPTTALAHDLSGEWLARHPANTDYVRGLLIVRRVPGGWRAEISGQTAPVSAAALLWSFQLQGGAGSFAGRVQSDGSILGVWTQPPTVDSGARYASPVTLTRDGANLWRGTVVPLDDPMTFYLVLKPMAGSSNGVENAMIFNPERDLGWQWDVDRVARNGDNLQLLASQKGRRKGQDQADGVYRAQDDLLSFYFSGRGGTYDFARVPASAATDFYPRGRPNAAYSYAPPPDTHDGWRVASVNDVGITQSRIESFVRMIVHTPMSSIHAPQIHALLIARHGKLVVEEYFHGDSRDTAHDTRSAAKSATSTLFGAAMQAGLPVSPSTPVYSAMNGGTVPTGLDPLKRSLTVESLLTMSAGLNCDDNDPASPGNENAMQDDPKVVDYYKFALDLSMIRPPGQKTVYCSIEPNLVGGVLTRVTHRSLQDLFADLVAGPLQISRYYMPLQPTGEPYMGGGLRLSARDFMKFGQLLMDKGIWNGRRVLSKQWCDRAISSIAYMSDYKTQYGYFWWIIDYPYKGATVRAFAALGNGGQDVVAIPKLDLVIATNAGNYGDRVGRIIQSDYIPKYILPAITR